MSLRPALSIAAVAVLSLAACAARPTRAGSPSPGPAPAVAASPADGQAGADAPAPPAASRPALLAAGTVLHLLMLEKDRPICQAWTVEDNPNQERGLWLVGKRQHQDRTLEVRYRYAWEAGRMVLTGYRRKMHAEGTLDLGQGGRCERAATMTEHPGGLDVGGSVWFARASDCEAALADELPVATDFGACTQRMDLPKKKEEKAAADEGMRRFDALMRGGGGLYELARTEAGDLECERWSVHAPDSRSRFGGIERIRRDESTITTTSFGYEWSPTGLEPIRGPAITLMGPHTSVQGPEGTGGKGRACALMVEVSGVNRDVVLMGGNRMYLTQDACEGAHQAVLARLRWLPPDGGTPAERMAALAGGGMPGC